MAEHHYERWNIPEIRDVLAEDEATATILALLDAESRRRGVDPTTATVGFFLDIGAKLAFTKLLNAGLQPRQAEAALTYRHVAPKALVRQLERSRTITVRPPHTDQ